jgi:hypothetical protein
MQDYDVTLKLLLQGSAKLTLRELTGVTVEKWLDVELPKVQNLRMDLGETGEGVLIHLELQSRNENGIPLRMAEYCLGAFRLFGRFPIQLLLYVGEAALRMECELRGLDVWFRYRAIDIRELDGERLLESAEVGDNVIAILARLRGHKDAIWRIVRKIAGLETPDRERALRQLLILSGLRNLAHTAVEQELRTMPIYIDIRENEVLGPMYERAVQQGKLEGEREGELKVLRRLIEKRFGALPAWAEERLTGRTTGELEELSLRVLDAESLEELLQ